MVKVVKRGAPKEKVYTFHCNHCESILEASEKEVSKSYGDQREPYTMYSIKCPVCSKTVSTQMPVIENR